MANRYFLIIACVVLVLGTSDVSGETSRHNGRVATMNIDHVMTKSKAAKAIQSKSEQIRQEIKKEVEAYEKILRQEDERVRALEVKGDPNFAAEYKKLEKKFQEAQKKYATRETELNDVFQEAREKLVQTLSEIVSVYAHEKGILLVLPAKVVIFAQDTLDITEEVMRRLDAALPSLEIDLSKSASDQKSQVKSS